MSDITETILFVMMIIAIFYIIHREGKLIKTFELTEQKILENVIKQLSLQQIDVTSILAQQHVAYVSESATEIRALVMSVEKLNSSVENVFTETSKVELAVSRVTDEVSKVTDSVQKVVNSVKDVQNAVIDLNEEYKGSHRK